MEDILELKRQKKINQLCWKNIVFQVDPTLIKNTPLCVYLYQINFTVLELIKVLCTFSFRLNYKGSQRTIADLLIFLPSHEIYLLYLLQDMANVELIVQDLLPIQRRLNTQVLQLTESLIYCKVLNTTPFLYNVKEKI